MNVIASKWFQGTILLLAFSCLRLVDAAEHSFQASVGAYLFIDDELVNTTVCNIIIAPGTASKQYSLPPIVVQDHPWDVVHFYTALLTLPPAAIAAAPSSTAPFTLYYAWPDGPVFNTTIRVCHAEHGRRNVDEAAASALPVD